MLLIDEIDKADSEVPNGLLETLGNGSFDVPYLSAQVGPAAHPPVVLITTNEERELPPAFLRRCLVLQLELPANPKKLTSWLVARANAHQFKCEKNVCEAAAAQLIDERQEAQLAGLTPPGQAEYLDILRALDSMAAGDNVKQLELLKWVGQFALKKQPGQQREGELTADQGEPRSE